MFASCAFLLPAFSYTVSIYLPGVLWMPRYNVGGPKNLFPRLSELFFFSLPVTSSQIPPSPARRHSEEHAVLPKTEEIKEKRSTPESVEQTGLCEVPSLPLRSREQEPLAVPILPMGSRQTGATSGEMRKRDFSLSASISVTNRKTNIYLV